MNELEKQLADIEDKIELEKYNDQKILTKEKVMAYLTNAILKKPKTLIHTLIQKIIVYEGKVEIFYNYTDETNPGDDSPRDLSYWLGSDSSAIPGSPDCSGSDSSVILGSSTTNPNQNEKKTKGSDFCFIKKIPTVLVGIFLTVAVRLVTVWWTETIQTRTPYSDFQKSGSASFPKPALTISTDANFTIRLRKINFRRQFLTY